MDFPAPPVNFATSVLAYTANGLSQWQTVILMVGGTLLAVVVIEMLIGAIRK